MYAEEFAKTADASGGTVNPDGTVTKTVTTYTQLGKISVPSGTQTVDITASVAQIAMPNAENKFANAYSIFC